MATMTESDVEGAALAWLAGLGYAVLHGPDIAPDMPAAERRGYGEVVLAQRLRDALESDIAGRVVWHVLPAYSN